MTEGEVKVDEAFRHAERVPQLDGLRGVAVLTVVAYHAWLIPGAYDLPGIAIGGRHMGPFGLLTRGYSGVELFFVLSGFCLAYPVYLRGGFDLRRYVISRARRILPPYWVMMVVATAIAALIAATGNQPFQLHQRSYGFQIERLPTMVDLAGGFVLHNNVLLSSYWTLPIEARWYLLFPPLVILALRSGGFSAFLLSAAVASVVVLYAFSTHAAFAIWGFSRLLLSLPIFAAGMLAADLVARGRPQWLRVLAIRLVWPGLVVSAVLVAALRPEPHDAPRLLLTWTPLYFFLVVGALETPLLRRVFGWRPLVSVGLVSYSVYLVHELVIWGADAVSQPLHISGVWRLVFFEGLVAPAAVAAGYVFFVLIERHWIHSRRWRPGASVRPDA